MFSFCCKSIFQWYCVKLLSIWENQVFSWRTHFLQMVTTRLPWKQRLLPQLSCCQLKHKLKYPCVIIKFMLRLSEQQTFPLNNSLLKADRICPTTELYKSIIWQITGKTTCYLIHFKFKSVGQFSMNNVSKMICRNAFSQKHLGYKTFTDETILTRSRLGWTLAGKRTCARGKPEGKVEWGYREKKHNIQTSRHVYLRRERNIRLIKNYSFLPMTPYTFLYLKLCCFWFRCSFLAKTSMFKLSLCQSDLNQNVFDRLWSRHVYL